MSECLRVSVHISTTFAGLIMWKIIFAHTTLAPLNINSKTGYQRRKKGEGSKTKFNQRREWQTKSHTVPVQSA